MNKMFDWGLPLDMFVIPNNTFKYLCRFYKLNKKQTDLFYIYKYKSTWSRNCFQEKGNIGKQSGKVNQHC